MVGAGRAPAACASGTKSAPASTTSPSRSRSLATQCLFGYTLNPFTSLYAGFSNGYIGSGNAGLVETDREVFLKLSYAFQL